MRPSFAESLPPPRSGAPVFYSVSRYRNEGKRNAERRRYCDRATRTNVATRPRGAPRRARAAGTPFRARGAPKTGALASRRSTAALASRSRPSGSAPGHASWDVADARSYGPPTGAKIVRVSTGVTTRPPVPVQGLNTHTGRSTGALMPKAARERVTSPRAGAALAPFQGVSSRRTSLDERDGAALSAARVLSMMVTVSMTCV